MKTDKADKADKANKARKAKEANEANESNESNEAEKKELVPTVSKQPFKFHLSDEKLGELYLSLKSKTFMQAAVSMGLDKHYAKTSLVPTTQKIAALVRLDPEKYGVSAKQVLEVDFAIGERNIRTSAKETALEKSIADSNQNFKNILEETRLGMLDIVHRKIKRLARSNKKIDEANLGTLVTSLAIVIDKLQLIRGEATENVAVLAKIDQTMSPEAALEMVLKTREVNLEAKHSKK